MLATQDLKEDGDGRRSKGGIVDEEVRAVEVEGHVESQVDAAGLWPAGLDDEAVLVHGIEQFPEMRWLITYRPPRDEGVKVSFLKQVLRRLLRRHRFDQVGTVIAQDGRVDTTSETEGTKIWVGPNPVIVNGLVCSNLLKIALFQFPFAIDMFRRTHHKRITLSGEDLDSIDGDGVSLDAIGLDDGQLVAVDAEGVGRVA